MKIKISSLKNPSLTNNGKLEVHWFGTASMLALGQTNTSLLVVKGNDHLLIDCGRNVPEAIKCCGLRPGRIDNFFITHVHADHVGGFSTLLTIRKFMEGLPPANVYGQKSFAEDLWGSVKGDLNLNGVGLGANDWYRYHFATDLDFRRETFEVGDLQVETFRTMHTPSDKHVSEGYLGEHNKSFGVLIDGRIWYSSDTKFDPELIEAYADRAVAMFHDGSITPNPVHASVGQLKTSPDEVKRKMYLVHYDATYQPRPDVSEFGGFVQPGTTFTFD